MSFLTFSQVVSKAQVLRQVGKVTSASLQELINDWYLILLDILVLLNLLLENPFPNLNLLATESSMRNPQIIPKRMKIKGKIFIVLILQKSDDECFKNLHYLLLFKFFTPFLYIFIIFPHPQHIN